MPYVSPLYVNSATGHFGIVSNLFEGWTTFSVGDVSGNFACYIVCASMQGVQENFSIFVAAFCCCCIFPICGY